LSWQFC